MVKISPSVLAADLSNLAAEVKDVIALTIGEPDFKTPWHIREAGIDSLEKGHTWYTANAGLMELRAEIANYMSRRFNISYNPQSEVIVTVGGSEAIDMAVRAVCCPGDEVIIPQPSYVCYEPITRLAGGGPVIINTKAENGFKITREELLSAGGMHLAGSPQGLADIIRRIVG